MSVQYRLMRPDDEHAVLTLWSTVFNVPFDQEYARLASDPHRFDTTHIAVGEDGTVLSTAHYRLYQRRDETGLPRRVAECDPIATAPSSQRAGHATKLIQFVLAAIEQEGCDWSILETSDMGRPLYTRLGWHAFPIRYRRGTLSATRSRIPSRYTVSSYPVPTTPADWEPLHDLYTRYNRLRPLTVVRDTAYWHSFAAIRLQLRIAQEQMIILAAYASQASADMLGYCFAHFFDFGFLVTELGADPQDRDTIAALLLAVGEEAERRGIRYGEVDLPYEPIVDAAVADLFGTTLHLSAANTRIMARAVNPALGAHELAAIFAAPGAWYSVIDHF